MGYWQYGLIEYEDAEFGEDQMLLHEIHFNEDGEITGWTAEPITLPAADNVPVFLEILDAVRRNIRLNSQPVLYHDSHGETWPARGYSLAKT